MKGKKARLSITYQVPRELPPSPVYDSPALKGKGSALKLMAKMDKRRKAINKKLK